MKKTLIALFALVIVAAIVVAFTSDFIAEKIQEVGSFVPNRWVPPSHSLGMATIGLMQRADFVVFQGSPVDLSGAFKANFSGDYVVIPDDEIVLRSEFYKGDQDVPAVRKRFKNESVRLSKNPAGHKLLLVPSDTKTGPTRYTYFWNGGTPKDPSDDQEKTFTVVVP